MTKKKEILSIIFLYIVSIAFFLGAMNMKGDAGLFPKLLSSIVFLLNTLEAYFVLVKGRNISKEKEDRSNKKLLTIFLLSLVYVLLLKPLGFIITSLAFLIACMFLLGVENKKIGIIVSVATVVVIYIAFVMMLKVQIPKGFIGI